MRGKKMCKKFHEKFQPLESNRMDTNKILFTNLQYAWALSIEHIEFVVRIPALALTKPESKLSTSCIQKSSTILQSVSSMNVGLISIIE